MADKESMLVPATAAKLSPTDEALSLLGAADADLLSLFLSTIANDNTRAAYRRDVAAFVAWITRHANSRPWALTEVTHVAAENWVREVTGAGLASATIGRRQSALARFFRWGSRPGGFNEGRPNPFSGDLIDRVKSSSVPAPALTAGEVQTMLQAAKAGAHPVRDWVVVMLLASTGLRVSELCAASHGDLRPVAGGCELIVTGKGGKVRAVPILPVVCDALGDEDDSAPLIRANDGGRLNRDQVERILTRLGRVADITHVTPHMLRSTAITEALAAGAPLWAVQDLAGHSDPRTTRGYQRRARSSEAEAAMAAALLARYVRGVMPTPTSEVYTSLAHAVEMLDWARFGGEVGPVVLSLPDSDRAAKMRQLGNWLIGCLIVVEGPGPPESSFELYQTSTCHPKPPAPPTLTISTDRLQRR